MSSAVLFGTEAIGKQVATGGLFGIGGAFDWGRTMTSIGLGSSVLTSVMGADAEAEALAYNARVQEQQALYTEDAAERNAMAEKRESDRQYEVLREQQRRERGQRLANWAKSGTAMAGSPFSVLSAADWMDDRDAQVLVSGSRSRVANALYNGAAEASGLRMGAAGDRGRVSSTRNMGYWKGASTLALGSRYYRSKEK